MTKTAILSLYMLAIGFSAFADSRIIYNRSRIPWLPETGVITADRFCYNQVINKFSVLMKAATKKKCSKYKINRDDSTRPRKICIIPKMTKVPSKRIQVPATFEACSGA